MKKLHATLLICAALLLMMLSVRGRLGNFSNIDEALYLKNTTGPFEANHEQSSYAELLMLKNHGTIQLDKKSADFGAPDVGYFPAEGKYYSLFPSGIAYLIAPLYNLGSLFGLAQVFSYFTVSLVNVAILVILYQTCKRVWSMSTQHALLVCLTYGFATFAWSYGVTIYQHIPTTFFAVTMFLCTYEYNKTKRVRFLFLIGSCYGLATFFDYPNLVILAPYVLYAAMHTMRYVSHNNQSSINISSDIVWILAPAALILVLHGARNAHYFGSPFFFANLLPRYSSNPHERTTWLFIKFTRPMFYDQFLVSGLLLYFILPEKAFWIFSPVLLMSFVGFYVMRNKLTSDQIFHMVTILFTTLFYASFFDAPGGYAFGPRYLVPCLPAMCYFAVMGAIQAGVRQHVRKALFTGMFALSSFLATAGALTTNMIPTSFDMALLAKPFSSIGQNVYMLTHDQSGSFFYHELARFFIPLSMYALCIWIVLMCFCIALLYSASVRQTNQ